METIWCVINQNKHNNNQTGNINNKQLYGIRFEEVALCNYLNEKYIFCSKCKTKLVLMDGNIDNMDNIDKVLNYCPNCATSDDPNKCSICFNNVIFNSEGMKISQWCYDHSRSYSCYRCNKVDYLIIYNQNNNINNNYIDTYDDDNDDDNDVEPKLCSSCDRKFIVCEYCKHGYKRSNRLLTWTNFNWSVCLICWAPDFSLFMNHGNPVNNTHIHKRYKEYRIGDTYYILSKRSWHRISCCGLLLARYKNNNKNNNRNDHRNDHRNDDSEMKCVAFNIIMDAPLDIFFLILSYVNNKKSVFIPKLKIPIVRGQLWETRIL